MLCGPIEILNDPKAGTPLPGNAGLGWRLSNCLLRWRRHRLFRPPPRIPEDRLLDAVEEEIGIRSTERLRFG